MITKELKTKKSKKIRMTITRSILSPKKFVWNVARTSRRLTLSCALPVFCMLVTLKFWLNGKLFSKKRLKSLKRRSLQSNQAIRMDDSSSWRPTIKRWCWDVHFVHYKGSARTCLFVINALKNSAKRGNKRCVPCVGKFTRQESKRFVRRAAQDRNGQI